LFAIGQTPTLNQWKQLILAKPDMKAVIGGGGNYPWIYINKNSKVEALRDERVRRAMVMLFDQKEIALATFGTAENIVEYSRGLFLPGLGNPNAEIAKIQGWDKPYDQRITEAKKLVADAGYAKGFTIYLPSMSAGNVISGTTYIAETWKKHLNIDYKIEPVTTAEYRKKLVAADFDAILGSLASSGVGDPDDQKNYFVSTSSLNFLGFKNPELDRLWKQQEAEQDPAKRTELIKQAERIAFSEYTMMPYPPSANNRVKYPYVKGYTLQNLFLGVYLHTTWLDK
jgi:oligopeptide transport system substrate-binding protein